MIFKNKLKQHLEIFAARLSKYHPSLTCCSWHGKTFEKMAENLSFFPAWGLRHQDSACLPAVLFTVIYIAMFYKPLIQYLHCFRPRLMLLPPCTAVCVYTCVLFRHRSFFASLHAHTSAQCLKNRDEGGHFVLGLCFLKHGCFSFKKLFYL